MRNFSLKRIKFAVVGESKGEFAPLVIQEGSETQLKGFPTVLSPISVRTEIGCPARHERIFYIIKINHNNLGNYKNQAF